MAKLNNDGTVRGLTKGSYYTGPAIKRTLSKYGKVTSYGDGNFGRMFEVNGKEAVFVEDTTGKIIRKYSIR